jgi:hypothetical protein
MSVVIVYAGTEGLACGPVPAGSFLKAYDPEAMDGYGLASWTGDKAEALVFGSFGEAFDAWRAIPASRPLRPDGKPNRPLTAFTVAFEDGPQ